MKNIKKLRFIFLLSVLPILVCYTQNSYAEEFTVYKCQAAAARSVRFQDTPCNSQMHMQVQTYTLDQTNSNDGLRLSEQAALQHMRTRQNLEQIEQMRIREQQREEAAMEARLQTQKSENTYVIINNNSAANRVITKPMQPQKSRSNQQRANFSINLRFSK